jgi:putative phosphoesterase
MPQSIVGVISDTHNLLRPEAVDALAGSQLIIHAGDIGNEGILDSLRRIAPVYAIRGNIDVHPWAAGLPATEVVQVQDVYLYVLHDVHALDLNPRAAGFAAVISGHSHVPSNEFRDGVLYFNPGSAGPRRFRLPISVGKMRIQQGSVTGELIPLS